MMKNKQKKNYDVLLDRIAELAYEDIPLKEKKENAIIFVDEIFPGADDTFKHETEMLATSMVNVHYCLKNVTSLARKYNKERAHD